MWNYEKRLQYPVKISQPNPKIAQVIISQFGGPDGMYKSSVLKKIHNSFKNHLFSHGHTALLLCIIRKVSHKIKNEEENELWKKCSQCYLQR